MNVKIELQRGRFILDNIQRNHSVTASCCGSILTVSCCGSFNSAWLWTELIYDDNGDGNGEAENVVDVDNVDDDDAGEDDDADDADGDEHLCHSEGHWSNAEVELLLSKRWVDQFLLHTIIMMILMMSMMMILRKPYSSGGL